MATLERRSPPLVNGKGSKTELQPDRAESGEQHLFRDRPPSILGAGFATVATTARHGDPPR
jgi:hypothetical protein